ncbi:MAG: rod shape-determining protein MreD [Chloroflexi bacterium]|nr:rod shape-determining protein MreD [Chloroflexota bacterium]
MNVRRFHPGFVTGLWLLPLLALLQSTLAGHLAVEGVMPGIVLIAVVNWGILRGMDEGMLWALIGGLCLDVFSDWPFGTNTVALVLVASVVSLGQSTFIRTHALLPLATVVAATILFYIVALFVMESLQQPVDWLRALQTGILPAALYNGLLNVVGFRLMQRLEERVYPMPRAHW